MRAIVCGGRDFNDIDFVVTRLLRLYERFELTEIITGGARGADAIGHEFAVELGLKTQVYKADWKEFGVGAGPIRNQTMLREGKPELVIAFPGGRGTADMVRRALSASVPVWRSELILFNSSDKKYSYLSNFATGFDFVDADGCIWPTAEHFYQSRKTDDEEIRSLIQGVPRAVDAKRAGAEIIIPEHWETEGKEAAMCETLAYKFAAGSEAAKLLLRTGENYLREFAPWGDTYWGTDGQEGLNRLGVLLMERRDQLDVENS